MTGQQLKNSILQMAVQGKLVPQDPNDEPASVLLERIRKEKEQLIKEGKIKKEKNPSYIFRGADNLPYEKVGKNEPVCIADEVPFDIPESWEWVRLKDLVIKEIKRGKSPKYADNGSVYVFAQKCNVKLGGIDISLAKFLDMKTFEKYPIEEYMVDGDIIINSTGNGTLGRIGMFHDTDRINDFIIVPDSHVTIVRACDQLKKDYLFYVLKYYQPYLEKLGEGSTNQTELRPSTVAELFVPIPPLGEQERIITKLLEVLPMVDVYGEKEKSLQAYNTNFPTQLKKSILQEAVQGKLVPQDPDDEPASVLLERIRAEKKQLIMAGKIKRDKHESVIFRRDNSHYEKLDGIERCIDDEIPFDLPLSWEWVRLGYLLKIESGKPLTSKQMKPGTIPVYGGNGITGYHNDYLVDEETVVIGRVGYYCGSVHATEPKAWVTDNAFITTYPMGCIDRDYLVFSLRSMNLGQNNNATAQPVVSGKKIYPMLFPLPPLAEQKRIALKLKEILPFCKTI